jgi:hypothetical protein
MERSLAPVITMLLVMMHQLPNRFLAVFYALTISRLNPRPAERNGLRIISGNIAGLVSAVAGMILFLDYPRGCLSLTLSRIPNTFHSPSKAASRRSPAMLFGRRSIGLASASARSPVSSRRHWEFRDRLSSDGLPVCRFIHRRRGLRHRLASLPPSFPRFHRGIHSAVCGRQRGGSVAGDVQPA